MLYFRQDNYNQDCKLGLRKSTANAGGSALYLGRGSPRAIGVRKTVRPETMERQVTEIPRIDFYYPRQKGGLGYFF